MYYWPPKVTHGQLSDVEAAALAEVRLRFYYTMIY